MEESGLATGAMKSPPDVYVRRAETRGSQRPHERHQVLLLLRIQLQFQNEIEELHRVLQRQQAVVVQVRRRVLDAAKRKGLDGAVGRRLAAVDRDLLEESLDLEVVHEVVGVVRRGVASGALALPEEDFLAAHLAPARLG